MPEKKNQKPIERAIDIFKENLDTVARVTEWAELMGYERPKRFSRHFLHYYGRRPQQVLVRIRLCSITKEIRTCQKKYYQIARSHSLPDEKALNNFTRRHIGYPPSKIKTMDENELQELLEGSESKNGE
jgi:transcriptional regulator GlxA family with amidase domain